MNIWELLYGKAKEQYHPTEGTPFVYAHPVVCALEAGNGEIYIVFCVESCSGVLNFCAERVAALNLYGNSGQIVRKRLIAFREKAPYSYIDEHPDHMLAGFTIFPMYRKKHIGKQAAELILKTCDGRWKMKHNEKNMAVKILWNQITTLLYHPVRYFCSEDETVQIEKQYLGGFLPCERKMLN